MRSLPRISAIEYVSDRVGLNCRVLVDAEQRAFRIQYDPWSLRGKRALLGEVWRGRVVSKDPGLGGCFVDIGLENIVFLQTKKAPPSDGSIVNLKIKTEAWLDKSAIAVLDNTTFNEFSTTEKGLLQTNTGSSFYDGVDVIDTIADRAAWDVIDEALERAAATSFALDGGGSIHVEPTRALVAVDIDAGGRLNKGDRSHFAFNLNKLAAKDIAFQISLSSIGGIVAVDFLKMKSPQENEKIIAEFQKHLELLLRRKNQFAKVSPFGVSELSIARRSSPITYLKSLICIEEKAALSALSALEREALSDRGASFKICVSQECYSWLKGEHIEWKSALRDRIGQRFEFLSDNTFSVDDFRIGKN